MRWDFGTVFKELRVGKGITQIELAEIGISRSNLSKIENNKSIPSYETMGRLLNYINVSYSEFEYICNEYKRNERYDILHEFYTITTNVEESKKKALYEKCVKYLSLNTDYVIQEIKDVLEVSNIFSNISKLHDSRLDKKQFIETWSRLDKVDAWTFEDMRHMNALMPVLPVQLIPQTIQQLLTALEKYDEYPPALPLILALHINLSTIHLHNKDFERCKEVLNVCRILATKQKRADYLGIVFVREGICHKDESKIEKGITLLKLIEEFDILEELNNEVKLFMV